MRISVKTFPCFPLSLFSLLVKYKSLDVPLVSISFHCCLVPGKALLQETVGNVGHVVFLQELEVITSFLASLAE